MKAEETMPSRPVLAPMLLAALMCSAALAQAPALPPPEAVSLDKL